MVYEALSPRAVEAYQGLQQDSAVALARKLIDDGDGWYSNVEQ